MMPEHLLQESEDAFHQAADRLLELAHSADESAFPVAFQQAHSEYLTASNRYRFALYEHAKTVQNSEVAEVYTKRADDLFVQTPFLVSIRVGYRKWRKL